MINNFMNR